MGSEIFIRDMGFQSTSLPNGWSVDNPDGSETWVVNSNYGYSSSSSNNPWMVLDGQHPCWKTAHSTQYNFVIRVEVTGGDDGVTYSSSGSYAAN